MPDYTLSTQSPFYRNFDIFSIIIDTGVTSIGENAFASCSSVKDVTFHNTVTRISAHAFDGCTSLEIVEIPNSVTEIGACAFSYTALKYACLPESVKRVGSCAFMSCGKLTDVTITAPDCVINESADTFSNTTGVFNGLISGAKGSTAQKYAEANSYGFKAFGEEMPAKYFAFDADTGTVLSYNGNASEVVIPSKINGTDVKALGDFCFNGCSGLRTVTLPKGLTSIGDSAFAYCTNLQGVDIPKGVTALGESVFFDCIRLSHVTIPEGVEEIDKNAFQYSAIKSITIPKSSTGIGYLAFYQCDRLSEIVILNPSSFIYNDSETILNDTLYGFTGTIYAPESSTAHSYADKYKYNFVALEDLTSGDVNFDTHLDSSDAALILKQYAQVQGGSCGDFKESSKYVADFNTDGNIDSSDAALILKTYAENQAK